MDAESLFHTNFPVPDVDRDGQQARFGTLSNKYLNFVLTRYKTRVWHPGPLWRPESFV